MIKSFLSLILLSVPLLASAQNAPEVIFPSAVEVSPRSSITAYDVAETRNMTDDVAMALQAIELGDDKTTIITKKDLASKIRQVRAKFILPSEIKILRSRQAISRMEVERKIKNHLTKNCRDCELQVQVNSVPTNVLADWDMDLNVDLNKPSVMIPIRSTQAMEKKGWIVTEIRRYQSIPVPNRTVRVGDAISSEMVSFEKRQLINPREVIQSVDQIVGMQAARYLSAGQPITYTDIKREQVLKKGQLVKAIAGHDFFEVSISAQAEEAGSVGDVIKIKNLDSQKVVAARIIEKGLVRIE